MRSTSPMQAECLGNAHARMGVCGGSVVASQGDWVHRSGLDMARALVQGLSLGGGHSGSITVDKALGHLLEKHW